MEGGITNNHNLKLIDLRFATITEIWREKFLCHKHGEIICAFVSFETRRCHKELLYVLITD